MINYLLDRGVLETTFAQYGGESGDPRDTAVIADRLNRDPAKVGRDPNWPAVENILWFPLRDVRGELINWLARALPSYNGAKFVAPTNLNGSAIWIPPETFAVAKHVSVPLVVTEGPVKAMVLIQAGAHPIAPIGVWGLTVKCEQCGEKPEEDSVRVKLHPSIASFQLTGRKVFMCFDSDRTQNPHVRQAELRSWMVFFAAGADVFELCTWELQDGKGVDDYIAKRVGTDPARQREVYHELFERAVPFIDTLKDWDVKTVTSELHRTQDDRAQFELLRTKLARALKIPKDSFGEFRRGEKDGGLSSVGIPPTAEPWDEPVEAKEVLDEICATIRRFEWLKPSQCRAVALWTVLTYLHDAVDILPILLITSPEESCGKTTLLKLVFYLSNRPVPAGNISAAAIYRTIADIAPTMALDEADTYLQSNEEMRGVIDSGHEREFAWVLRTAMEGEDVKRFSTWCPKALAMIGLPKRTILSRSIHVRLDRKSAEVKTEKLKKKHYGEFADLRRKISRLANDIREQVRVFEIDDLLSNRAADNWQPLFAIANAAGNDWVCETVKAAEQMCKKDVQDSKSTERYLLESLARIIKEHREEKNKAGDSELGIHAEESRLFLSTSDLLEKLNHDEEAPWMENRDGKKAELSPHRLAALLRKYDVESDQPKIAGKRARGYWADVLEKAIEKYAADGV